jgi:serine phosphatase RsbU (regulator of sigma subunit)/pSer/pThr/pTyr-binding forkhead associated (FHA) protein
VFWKNLIGEKEMDHLHILKGASQGQKISLEGKSKIVLGRSADCDIVINDPAVSRSHAQILRLQGQFYIEDLKSRNSTFINHLAIAARTPLRDNDRIKICDFLCTFHSDESHTPFPAQPTRPGAEAVEESETSSTIEVTVSDSRQQILAAQPAERLPMLVDLTRELAQTFQLNQLLPKIVDRLFQLFKQADRGFIILRDEDTGQLVPRVIQTRLNREGATPRFSRKIVYHCIETGHGLLSKDASTDPKFDPSESIAESNIRSVMCVPLLARDTNRVFGVIQLDTQDRAKKFTTDDLKLLVAVASLAAIAVENAQLYQDMQTRDQTERDLEQARQVQRSILPEHLPEVPGYEFFAHYASALEVGGDYYDFVMLPDRRLAVMIGDVAGKGMPAALLMAKLCSDARYCLLAEADPAAAVRRLNNLVHPASHQTHRFVTLIAALLDLTRQEVTLVNAGHVTPLILRRASSRVEEAMPRELAGLPVGVQKDCQYASHLVRLQPGDCLLLFTDGVTEATDKQDKQFRMQRVFETLQAGLSAPRTLGERLVTAVKQHSVGCKQVDDITVVCFGRTV